MGATRVRLTATEAAEDHPSWSPDGSKILFDADYDDDGFYEIYTMNLDGTEITRLTFNAANDQFADWSPDGSQIAFSSDRNGNWDIFIMDADGSQPAATNQQPRLGTLPGLVARWKTDCLQRTGTQFTKYGCLPDGCRWQ